MKVIKNILKISLISILMLLISNINVFAFDLSNKINIYNTSDLDGRSQIDVLSIKNTNYINFYADQYWWNKLQSSDQYNVSNFITSLSSEFEYNIYPKITNTLPNITQWLNYREKLIVVFTPMGSGIQGYVRWDDFNSKAQSRTSNEGNIIYLNPNNVLNPSISNNILFSFFAHELMHLITFQEKNVRYNTEEDTWLEELRSEYLSHFLGYNQNKDSYLNFRLQNGVSLTDVNLINWNNSNNVYSLINLFGIYLTQRFTPSIIFDTLTSNQSGITSINRFLIQKGYKERFSDIYQDWIIANILNNCKVNSNYCYKDIDIQITVPGTSFFLPFDNDSELSISDSLSNYQTKYQKIVGGSDNLNIILENTKNNIFQKIPYILIDKENNKTLNFFEFKNETVKQIDIKNYSKQYSNIIIIPMFASSDNSSQLFKWHIYSSNNSTTNTTIKSMILTTTTTSKGTTTTKPDFGTSSPIIINVITPQKSTPFYISIGIAFKTFFKKIFSWMF